MARGRSCPRTLFVALTQNQKDFLGRGQNLVRKGVISMDDSLRHFKQQFRGAPKMTVSDLAGMVKSGLIQPAIA